MKTKIIRVGPSIENPKVIKLEFNIEPKVEGTTMTTQHVLKWLSDYIVRNQDRFHKEYPKLMDHSKRLSDELDYNRAKLRNHEN